MADDKDIDITTAPFLSNSSLEQFNFLRTSAAGRFRRHFRSGLRSHLFELIRAEDLETEQTGKIIGNIRLFPRARPSRMLRVLRTPFDSLDQALGEIQKYKLLLKYLGPGLIAKSEEFIVEYRGTGAREILLCGLQEYIRGTTLDPWHLTGKEALKHFYTPNATTHYREFTHRAARDIKTFVAAVRRMIHATAHIPDLAGVGNLMLTHEGGLKLVDINNVIKIRQNPDIHLDDRGYPCCDKSMEVLFILEHKILQQPLPMDDPLYQRFFTPERIDRVKELEQAFYDRLNKVP
ncbi:MAG: hypothetical protein GY737_02315 [Desulfobacteraceae bacterium]|nr:hypothetical protein [Desulfobacteraceae bacterium]